MKICLCCGAQFAPETPHCLACGECSFDSAPMPALPDPGAVIAPEEPAVIDEPKEAPAGDAPMADTQPDPAVSPAKRGPGRPRKDAPN